MTRATLYHFAGGHLGEYEDWWYFVQDDDGTTYVEHKSDHISVRGGSQSEGSEKYTVEQALAGAAPQEAVKKLKELLRSS